MVAQWLENNVLKNFPNNYTLHIQVIKQETKLSQLLYLLYGGKSLSYSAGFQLPMAQK